MKKGLIISLIIAAGLVAYSNSLFNQFVWDDNQIIVQNEYIRDFKHLPQIFLSDLFHFGYAPGNFYRPVQTLSYAIDHRIWGMNPFGYHLTSVALHILAAILIFFLIRLIFQNSAIAFLTGLLFVIHPIHTEAVSYISSRSDILATVFLLSSLLLFIKHIKGQGTAPFYIFSVLLYALSLLSKEAAVMFPLLYVFFAVIFAAKDSRKKSVAAVALFLIIDLLYIILRLTVFNFTKAPVFAGSAPLLQRLYSIPRVLLDYLRLLVFPIDLHMEREVLPLSFAGIALLAAAVIFTAYLILAAYKNKNYAAQSNYFAAWFFITLLPALNLVPVNAVIAEHWLYLPSISMFLFAAVGLNSAASRFKKTIVYALAAALFTAYAAATIKYNTFWHDNSTLYRHTLTLSPDSARVHNNMGKVYDLSGNYDKAAAEYEAAIKIKPDYAMAHNNLGVVLDKLGRPEEAIAHYNTAIAINPDFAQAYNNLGTTYRKMGMLDNAIPEYERSVKIKPDYAEAYNNLGMVYYAKGALDTAAKDYEKAIKLNPDLAEAYNNLGVVYARKGLMSEAAKCWETALKINPAYASPKANLERLRKMAQ
ncbi:MAG: tetratricopeptide repeat protein [Candidatus Omnitrophica bacterium]|nr:tetratricopeptide repeat protein [Candidatus Omnitrophota bacterium]